MVVVGRAGSRRLIALELGQVHVPRPGARVGGQRDPERRPSADPLLHPCPAVVQLGEPSDEREPDPDGDGDVIEVDNPSKWLKSGEKDSARTPPRK